MLLNSILAPAVLAYVTAAAPTYPEPAPTTTVAPVLPASTGLSLSQQLFLADTAADRFALLPRDEQFKFAFHDPALMDKGGMGGDLIIANRKTFPALVGTGSGMAVGFLKGCGFNTPHVHSRATELQIIVPENGVFNTPGDITSGRRVIKNTINQFEMQPFYQGSVHSQFNPTCDPAVFVASFNSEDFGASQVTDELFAMSPNVVIAAFGEWFRRRQANP
ncbi:RmlC-like cupin domain-containing protein [Leptodontidium sp. 2 PMI_412]|nr:RmlC-like cupin domain-containing protein [Leptodontidium sp. 2 PMI_412]